MCLVVKRIERLNFFLGKMETLSSSYNCYDDVKNKLLLLLSNVNILLLLSFLELLSVPVTMLDTLQTSSVTLKIISMGDFINLKLEAKAQRGEIIFSRSHKVTFKFCHL